MALAQLQNPRLYRNKMPFLKKLFWAYFLLLIFEGALRKWILPQLSAPLLLVRDPIALLIIIEASRGIINGPRNGRLLPGSLLSGCSACAARR